MSGLIDSATMILTSNERRLEVISQNITNASTPGYKRQIAFSQILNNTQNSIPQNNNINSKFLETTQDFMPYMSQGQVKETGNPLDLAIVGDGLFLMRQDEEYYYSRSGQFSLNEDGSLMNAQGMILQQAGGGDLIVESTAIEILNDGTVLDQGRPIASISLFQFNGEPGSRMVSMGGSIFSANQENMEEAAGATLRQGMIESSNVELSDEMIAMTKSVRQSESGARIAQVYDQLMSQAISRFGGGR